MKYKNDVVDSRILKQLVPKMVTNDHDNIESLE